MELGTHHVLISKGTPTQIASQLDVSYDQIQKVCQAITKAGRAKKAVVPTVSRETTLRFKKRGWINLMLTAQASSVKSHSGRRVRRYTVSLWGVRIPVHRSPIKRFWDWLKGDR